MVESVSKHFANVVGYLSKAAEVNGIGVVVDNPPVLNEATDSGYKFFCKLFNKVMGDVFRVTELAPVSSNPVGKV